MGMVVEGTGAWENQFLVDQTLWVTACWHSWRAGIVEGSFFIFIIYYLFIFSFGLVTAMRGNRFPGVRPWVPVQSLYCFE
jgi:hypothetical protein